MTTESSVAYNHYLLNFNLLEINKRRTHLFNSWLLKVKHTDALYNFSLDYNKNKTIRNLDNMNYLKKYSIIDDDFLDYNFELFKINTKFGNPNQNSVKIKNKYLFNSAIDNINEYWSYFATPSSILQNFNGLDYQYLEKNQKMSKYLLSAENKIINNYYNNIEQSDFNLDPINDNSYLNFYKNYLKFKNYNNFIKFYLNNLNIKNNDISFDKYYTNVNYLKNKFILNKYNIESLQFNEDFSYNDTGFDLSVFFNN